MSAQCASERLNETKQVFCTLYRDTSGCLSWGPQVLLLLRGSRPRKTVPLWQPLLEASLSRLP
jgi:hypothetical protein